MSIHDSDRAPSDVKPAARPRSRIKMMLGIGLVVIVPLALVVIYFKYTAEPDVQGGELTPQVVAEIKDAEAALQASPFGRAPAVGVVFQAMPGLTGEMRPIQAMVGRFHVYREGSPDPQGGRRHLIVSLPAPWTDAPPGIIHGPHFGTIARELINQAFLLAARDELGMATREVTLGESLPKQPPDLFVEVIAPYRTVEPLVVTIRRESEKGELVLSKEFPLWTDDARDYALYTAKAEALSRSTFVEMLKAAGLKGRANQVSPEKKPVPDVADLLETMSFPTQFEVLRRLHKEIRSDGESPMRLAALSRSYVQLGNMIEYQWSPADKYYKARALLYAERGVTRSPKSAQALRDRAFVRALVGLHSMALDDLEAASKVVGAGPEQPPALTNLVDAFCRFDTKTLGEVNDGPHVGLAQWLKFQTAENYYDSQARTLAMARESLDANPEGFRILDAMCQAGSLGTLHQVTELAPRHLAATLPPRLLAMSDVPAKVKTVLTEKPDDVALTNALETAGAAELDTSEPSWSALGRIIEEARFIHVMRRADFMSNKWHVPVQDFLIDSWPLVAKHPFARYIESFGRGVNAGRGPQRSQFNHADLEMNELPYIRSLKQSDVQVSAMLTILSQRHGDEVYRDLEMGTRLFDDSTQRVSMPLAARLQATSPHSPFAAAILIKSYWDLAEPHVAEWEKRFAQHPQVFGSLAARYRAMNRLDDEKRCLSKFTEIVPDALWPYERLAEIELAAGHADQWKAILDSYLAKTESDGLEHAKVQVEIAHHFMAKGEWAKAQPYAEEAAQTWAGWAMECAAECYEQMGNWTQAELWYQREAERYQVSWFQWFQFCKRTGHGDVKAAKVWVVAYLKANEGQLSDNEEGLATLFFDLGHEPAQGIEFLKARFPRPVHNLEGLFLAMFADQLDNATLRDETLKRIPNEDPFVASVAALLFTSMTEKKELDLKQFDALIEPAPGPRQADLCYFVGRFLEQHGRLGAAQTYLRRCADSAKAKPLFRTLATSALRDINSNKSKAIVL